MDTKDITGLMEAYVAVYDDELRDELDDENYLMQEDFSFIDDLSDTDLVRIMESILSEGQFTLDECLDAFDGEYLYEARVTMGRGDEPAAGRGRVTYSKAEQERRGRVGRKHALKRLEVATGRAAQKGQRAATLGGGAVSAAAGGARDVGTAIRGRLAAAKEGIKGFLSRTGSAISRKTREMKQQSHIPLAKYASRRDLMPGAGLKTQSSRGRKELRGAVVSDVGQRAVSKVRAQKAAVKKGAKGLVGRAAGYVARKAGELAQRMNAEDYEIVLSLIAEDLIQEGYAETFEDVLIILEDLSENEFDGLVESYLDSEVEVEDHYDTVMEFLMAEGFADTEEDAEVIMANMSDAWREEILEAAPEYNMSRRISTYTGKGEDTEEERKAKEERRKKRGGRMSWEDRSDPRRTGGSRGR